MNDHFAPGPAAARRRRFGREAFSMALAVASCCLCGCPDSHSPVHLPDQGVAVDPETAYSAGRFVFVQPTGSPTFAYENGELDDVHAILETLGGGPALFDYDGDGRLDLFLTGGGVFPEQKSLRGAASLLLRNEGPWRFSPVTDEAGVRADGRYTHAGCAADFDNDGFIDLLVTGYGGLQFYQNQGDGTFVERTGASKLSEDHLWSVGAAWADVNGDGALDLYVVHHVDWSFENHPDFCRVNGVRDACAPSAFEPLPDSLFISGRDGTFSDNSAAAGLRNDGKGLGVLAFDKDRDGKIDFYVTNDSTPNFVYLNDGDGKLREVGLLEGGALDEMGAANGSMGVAALDYDRDGLLDVLVTNFEQESMALYHNDEPVGFSCRTVPMGLYSLDHYYVGWGCVAGDFDLDGNEEIVVSNGHAFRFPSSGTNRQFALFLAIDPAPKNFIHAVRFAEAEGYFGQMHRGRGVAMGDLDNDGRLDLVFSHVREPVAILENRSPSVGRSIALRLVGRASNRTAIGAEATLRTTEGDRVKQIIGGGSYVSQSDLRLHFGLSPGCSTTGLLVKWPSGARSELGADEITAETLLLEPDPPFDLDAATEPRDPANHTGETR